MINKNVTKAELLKEIAELSVSEEIGLFIGAGFSIAVNQVCNNCSPLKWPDLLKEICSRQEIDWDKIEKDFIGCPQIASKICEKIAQKQNISEKDATNILKMDICHICAWYANEEQRDKFRPILEEINPKWIITTNYDFILETLLPYNSLPISPEDTFSYKKSEIPIYHLHGLISDHETIVITNEDYIKLFRPHNYRMDRLSIMFKESVTLILGYSLGDPNVLAALDLAKNIYNNKDHSNEVIQFLYKHEPKTDPYDQYGITILETDNLYNLLQEIKEEITKTKKQKKEEQDEIRTIKTELLKHDMNSVNQFIKDTTYRTELFSKMISQKELLIATDSYITSVFNTLWDKAKERNNFKAYKDILEIIMHIFSTYKIKKIPPSIYILLIKNLDSVAYYVGKRTGYSYEACNYWEKNNKNITVLCWT